MASFYSIVQYVPDAARAERINIGVIAYDSERVCHVFLSNWTRVKHFAGADISFLKDVARDVRNWNADTVKRLSETWTGSVQITSPSASTLCPDRLLTYAGSRCLVEETLEQRRYRRMCDATNIVKRIIREKLRDHMGSIGSTLLGHEVRGKQMTYGFDAVVSNGQPYFAAQGISFEVPDTRRHLQKQIFSTAWLIQDVKLEYPELDIGVLALEPPEPSPSYIDAIRIFSDLKATLLTEENISAWVSEKTNLIPLPDAH